MIFTIGYASLGFEKETIIPQLEELTKKHDAILIDIRSNPYGLVNMPDLKKALGKAYEWHQKLGHPQWKELKTYRLDHENIILMCCEKSHTKCHREPLSVKMREWRNRGEQIEHLNSSPERLRQRSLFPR